MTYFTVGIIGFSIGSIFCFILSCVIIASSDKKGCNCANCSAVVDSELNEIYPLGKEEV